MKLWKKLGQGVCRYYKVATPIAVILLLLGGALLILPGQPKKPVQRSRASKPVPAARYSAAKPFIITQQFAASPAWSQDFTTMKNGPLSGSIWAYDLGNGAPDNPGWGNNENEYYTDRPGNVRIENGQLIIEAQKESIGEFNYTAARITTTPSLNFTYGKLDIVAKLPAGTGSWPALWLLPSGSKYELTTPAGQRDPNNSLRDGEIDMLEATGSIPAQITSSAHSYTYNLHNNNERIATSTVTDDTTAFHDYELQWTPTTLVFLVDGVPYHTVTKSPGDSHDVWPYDQPYYLILNVAMGGTEGGTEIQQYPPYGIDDSSGPWKMAVKSINYYPYKG